LLRSVFDDVASRYENILPAHISKHYLEKRVRFLSHYLNKDSKILDVGCGTGRLINNLSMLGDLEICGCDNSIEMLKIAKMPGDCRLICSSSDYLPYTDNTFDAVISVSVFHHLKSQGAMLRTMNEMIRVTKKNGRVVIWDANPLNPYWFFLFKRIPYDKDVKMLMPLKKIISEAKRYNLKKIEVLRNGWIPDFIPRKLLSLFKLLEHILEHTPILKLFSAHNVIIFTK